MEVSEFLSRAAGASNCVHEAENAFSEFVDAVFVKAKLIRDKFIIHDKKVGLDGDGLMWMDFVLRCEISKDYVICMRSALVRGELSVFIYTAQMTDRHGLTSDRYRIVDGLEDNVEPRPFWELSILAEQVVKVAMRHHRELIVRAGVQDTRAEELVECMWKGGAA